MNDSGLWAGVSARVRAEGKNEWVKVVRPRLWEVTRLNGVVIC